MNKNVSIDYNSLKEQSVFVCLNINMIQIFAILCLAIAYHLRDRFEYCVLI
jgi:hypothetical protein